MYQGGFQPIGAGPSQSQTQSQSQWGGLASQSTFAAFASDARARRLQHRDPSASPLPPCPGGSQPQSQPTPARSQDYNSRRCPPFPGEADRSRGSASLMAPPCGPQQACAVDAAPPSRPLLLLAAQQQPPFRRSGGQLVAAVAAVAAGPAQRVLNNHAAVSANTQASLRRLDPSSLTPSPPGTPSPPPRSSPPKQIAQTLLVAGEPLQPMTGHPSAAAVSAQEKPTPMPVAGPIPAPSAPTGAPAVPPVAATHPAEFANAVTMAAGQWFLAQLQQSQSQWPGGGLPSIAATGPAMGPLTSAPPWAVPTSSQTQSAPPTVPTMALSMPSTGMPATATTATLPTSTAAVEAPSLEGLRGRRPKTVKKRPPPPQVREDAIESTAATAVAKANGIEGSLVQERAVPSHAAEEPFEAALVGPSWLVGPARTAVTEPVAVNREGCLCRAQHDADLPLPRPEAPNACLASLDEVPALTAAEAHGVRLFRALSTGAFPPTTRRSSKTSSSGWNGTAVPTLLAAVHTALDDAEALLWSERPCAGSAVGGRDSLAAALTACFRSANATSVAAVALDAVVRRVVPWVAATDPPTGAVEAAAAGIGAATAGLIACMGLREPYSPPPAMSTFHVLTASLEAALLSTASEHRDNSDKGSTAVAAAFVAGVACIVGDEGPTPKSDSECGAGGGDIGPTRDAPEWHGPRLMLLDDTCGTPRTMPPDSLIAFVYDLLEGAEGCMKMLAAETTERTRTEGTIESEEEPPQTLTRHRSERGDLAREDAQPSQADTSTPTALALLSQALQCEARRCWFRSLGRITRRRRHAGRTGSILAPAPPCPPPPPPVGFAAVHSNGAPVAMDRLACAAAFADSPPLAIFGVPVSLPVLRHLLERGLAGQCPSPLFTPISPSHLPSRTL